VSRLNAHLVCLEVRKRADWAARHVLRKSHLRGHSGPLGVLWVDARIYRSLHRVEINAEKELHLLQSNTRSLEGQQRTGASKTAREKHFCRRGCDDSAARSVVVPCECPALTVLQAPRVSSSKTGSVAWKPPQGSAPKACCTQERRSYLCS